MLRQAIYAIYLNSKKTLFYFSRHPRFEKKFRTAVFCGYQLSKNDDETDSSVLSKFYLFPWCKIFRRFAVT